MVFFQTVETRPKSESAPRMSRGHRKKNSKRVPSATVKHFRAGRKFDAVPFIARVLFIQSILRKKRARRTTFFPASPWMIHGREKTGHEFLGNSPVVFLLGPENCEKVCRRARAGSQRCMYFHNKIGVAQRFRETRTISAAARDNRTRTSLFRVRFARVPAIYLLATILGHAVAFFCVPSSTGSPEKFARNKNCLLRLQATTREFLPFLILEG